MTRTLETDFRDPRFLQERLGHLRPIIGRPATHAADAEP
jgi:hypothetical protein